MLSNARARIKIFLGPQALNFSKALSVSVFNQAVSSGTNFMMGLYLVHILSPEAFGLYSIGFALSLFYANVGNALLLTQMVVHVPDKTLVDRPTYAARMFIAVSVFCFFTSIFIIVLILLSSFFSVWVQQYQKLGFATVAASVSYLVKEFFVRYAYTVRREIWALGINIWVALALGCFVITGHLIGKDFNSVSSLWLYALSHATGALAGFLLAGLQLKTVRFYQLKVDCAEAWAGGKWATATTCCYFLRTQAHTIITASMLGPVAVAYLNATRLLVAPMFILTPALSQVFLPRLATLRTLDSQKVPRAGMVFSAILLSITIIYSCFILTFLQCISNLVFGLKYASPFILVLSWCILAIILSFRDGTEMVFQVMKQFRILTVVNTLSAIVALISVYGLVNLVGVTGAIFGMVLGEVVLISLLLFKSKTCL